MRRGRAIALLVVLALACGAVAIAIVYHLQHAPTATQAFQETFAWNEEDAPNYYMVVGPAHFEKTLSPGEVEYSPLDWLGRAGKVLACIDAPLAEAGTARDRNDTSGIHPSGWGYNDEVTIELPTGGTYHGYLWNRSHLLAKSLGGQEIEENLICGTRMQNVGANVHGAEGGMAYPESIVREWLANHPNGYVHFSAEPVYVGNEPVCRAVVVDVRSSDGSVDSEIVVYNAAKGYEIDYATGDFTS